MTDLIMPRLGLTMEEGTVQRWLAAEGDYVEAGQAVLEVETDKVIVEVECPAAGVIGPLLVQEGQKVPIGTVLAEIHGGKAPGQSTGPAITATSAPVDAGSLARVPRAGRAVQVPALRAPSLARSIAAEEGVELETVRGSGPAGRTTAKDVQEAGLRGKVFSSPRARKRARELKVDWHSLPGTGPQGRVIERDVLRAAADGRPSPIAHEPSDNAHRPAPITDVAWESPTLVQRVAAHRMAGSFSVAPHFYLSAEARADALLELHERLLPVVERRVGVRLTITDLLAKIVATALQEHPRANAFWAPEGSGRIGLHQRIHLGIAVATDAGLVVPVLRDAGSIGLAQITAERDRLVEKARRGELSLDDLEGSTFTLTNLGMYRVDAFQAILNPPQSAILAVGRIVERPVAIAGQLCVRPTMVVTLSCDHRVLDGVLGAQFLGRVVELIEEPYGLMA